MTEFASYSLLDGSPNSRKVTRLGKRVTEEPPERCYPCSLSVLLSGLRVWPAGLAAALAPFLKSITLIIKRNIPAPVDYVVMTECSPVLKISPMKATCLTR